MIGAAVPVVPVVSDVRVARGVAGALEVSALVAYPGEAPRRAVFAGSFYGGPVLLVSAPGGGVWVDDAVTARCGGVLSAVWVRRFFGADDAAGGAL